MKQKHSTCWVSRLSTKTADHLVIRVITLLIVFVFSQVNSCNPFTTISWILRSSMNNNYHFPENNDSSTTYYCFHYIARDRGHFAPVISCQRNLIFKMTDKNDRSQGKRIPCDFLNNLNSVISVSYTHLTLPTKRIV